MTVASVSFVQSGTFARTKDSISLADVLAFLIPAILAVNLQITGRLFVSELILIAALPFLLARDHVARSGPWTTALVAAGLLWLWAQVITDLYHSTPFNDLARGWLSVAFTVADFVAILVLISGRQRRIILFTAGLAVGYALEYRLNPSPFVEVDPWKFGIAVPVTLLLVLLSCHSFFYRTRFLSSISLVFTGILNFTFGFRSLGGICLLAGAYVAAQAFSRRTRSLRITPLGLVPVCLIAIVSAVLLLTVYNHAARDGFLGAPAAQKYRQESSGKFGVLLGGRPELFASSKAIADSPLLGHGSQAKDPKYTNDLLSLLSRNGYQPSGGLRYSIQHSGYAIPSHSYLFQAWVEAGFLGAVFWFIVLGLAVVTLSDAFRTRPSLSPLIAFLGIQLVWNVFFSPYGADHRIFAMFSSAALLTCRSMVNEKVRRGLHESARSRPPSAAEVASSQAPAW